jgi:acetyl esterase/lipase
MLGMSSRGVLVVNMAVAVAVLVGCLGGPVAQQLVSGGSTMPAPVMSDIAYASASSAEVLDVWLPSGAAQPYPLVIFVHGGGFSSGDKRDVGPKVAPLLQHGFAVASVNYRLSGEAHFPAAAQDVKEAVRYLRAHASAHNIDPGRFAIWGESAGANLAVLAGVTASQRTIFDDGGLGVDASAASIQAVVDWYGPIDFAQRESQYRGGGSDCRAPQLADADRFTTGYLGADVDRVPQEAAAANPTTYVRSAVGLPPFSIAHGSADCLVPVIQAQQLADTLRAAGGLADLHLLPGAVHADPRFDRELLAPTIAWLSGILGRKG